MLGPGGQVATDPKKRPTTGGKGHRPVAMDSRVCSGFKLRSDVSFLEEKAT